MNASPTPSTTSSPASAIWLSVSPPNAGTNRPSISALGRLPAGAVGHRDVRVAELGAPAADVLDQAEHVLLAVGHSDLIAHHTTSRSRAKRPKL